MKKIPLSKGKYAVVDDEDYEALSLYKWWFMENSGYAARSDKMIQRKRGKTILLHKQILNPPDGFFTDHINGDKLDNRRTNLRSATKSQNGMNRDKRKDNKSGYKGVYWHKAAEKWAAEIRLNYKKIYLGCFSNINDAIKARHLADIQYFGEYRRNHA